MCAGRRVGKSVLLGLIETVTCLQNPGSIVWHLAPTSTMANIGWRNMLHLCKGLYSKKHETNRYIIFPNGSEFWCKSTDNYDGLRGESLDLAVLDEAAFIAEPVWNRIIRPMLSDRKGKALFASTPNGLNWFYDIWKLGQKNDNEDLYPEWISWRYPTSVNPYMPVGEVEAAKKTLPEQEYNQEYEAQFLGDGLSVFRNIDGICTAIAERVPIQGHYYVCGVDWGQQDFTVVSIIDATTKTQVYIERWNRTDYRILYTLIEGLCKRFNVSRVLAEDNSIGLHNAQALKERGLPVELFETTNDSKMQMVQHLMYAMENYEVTLLKDDRLIGEMKAFVSTRLPSGKYRYAASRGNDDMVMATLLSVNLLNWNVAFSATEIAKVIPRAAVAASVKKQKSNHIFPYSNY